jgi:DNA-binding transcriptional regulator YhcF (GntR family)
MLPFKVTFKSGVSVCQQAVYAAKKSLVSGQLRPGDLFPSVRALSQALKINPNTAHKVVMELTREGLLEVRPGLGTVVAEPPQASAQRRTALLRDNLEQLVVEAKHLGIDLDDLVGALAEHWEQLSADSPNAKPAKRLAKEKA